MFRSAIGKGIFQLLGSLFVLLVAVDPLDGRESLRVMSFNLWVGGEAGGQPLEQTIKVIQAAKADLVGMQETYGEERNGKRMAAGRAIAAKLGWNYSDQTGEGPAVVSRYPILDHTTTKQGVAVELPSRRKVWLFNVHFAHAPYQPYQLLKIPYADAPFVDTAEQAVSEACKARGAQVTALLQDVEGVRKDGCPVIITGDFNEPSSLDWGEVVREARRCPAVVAWPTTRAVLEAGFVDAYRRTHPDVLKWPGFTWTPLTSEDDPQDRHDRIDFVFVSGAETSVEKCEVVGERPQRADIVVAPYPSDHRAVVATVVFE